MLASLRSSWTATAAPRVSPLLGGSPPRRVAAACERPARRAAREGREPLRRG
jgi:hypothetical protein